MRDAPVSLQSERLLLRPHQERDLPAMIAGLGDREVARRLRSVPHPYAESDARWWIEHARDQCAAGLMHDLLLERLSDGRVIGGIGLVVAENPVLATCGYWIARDQWGNGYAREALARLVRFAFFEISPPFARLEACVHVGNEASRRVLESCGFLDIGMEECPCAATGGVEAAHLYALRVEG